MGFRRKTVNLFRPKINRHYEEFYNKADPILQLSLPVPIVNIGKVITTETGIEIKTKEKRRANWIVQLQEDVKNLAGLNL